MSPYELINVHWKGLPVWRSCLWLCQSGGKSSSTLEQNVFDTYILYDGRGLVLTRSVRRVDTNWRSHLKYYMNFAQWSWEYKPGFGGRILPTKATKTTIGASYHGPSGAIEPSPFVDEDAEAVKQKHWEEVREEEEEEEEEETSEMALKDRMPKVVEFREEPEVLVLEPSTSDAVFTDEGEVTIAHAPEPILPSHSAASSSAPMLQMDVPQTLDAGDSAPITPRHSPTTRVHDVEPDDDHSSKRARVEAAKKQRLDRISSDYESMIRTVKISDEAYHTMDEYENELRIDDHELDDEFNHEDDDGVSTNGIPADLWPDSPADKNSDEPEAWIDRRADMVELGILCGMQVIEEVTDGKLSGEEHLTTKFVYDWRLEDFAAEDGSTCKRWLRRSRLVAHEFSFLEGRSDTYSPATSTHVLNILPMLYLQKLGDVLHCTWNS